MTTYGYRLTTDIVIQYSPDVLVIDSINVLGSTIDYSKSIWIAQSTKDGNYKGEMGVSHEADIVCCVVRHGKLQISKNRFGNVGIFDF